MECSVQALVSVLQAVGRHSDHGMTAIEAVGAVAWMQVEVGSDPWGASSAVPSPPLLCSQEEDFWKVEEKALHDLVEKGTLRWREASGGAPDQHPSSVSTRGQVFVEQVRHLKQCGITPGFCNFN